VTLLIVATRSARYHWWSPEIFWLTALHSPPTSKQKSRQAVGLSALLSSSCSDLNCNLPCCADPDPRLRRPHISYGLQKSSKLDRVQWLFARVWHVAQQLSRPISVQLVLPLPLDLSFPALRGHFCHSRPPVSHRPHTDSYEPLQRSLQHGTRHKRRLMRKHI